MMEQGWLIEDPQRHADESPKWLAGAAATFFFTPDANRAIRFARKCDAEQVLLARRLDIDGCIVTEHGWGE